ncbi:MAG: type II toxin-antitoxin system Phd/YefM family antitoxin [Eubacteriales bacterium]|nr:type II toxin-antitoxin system Phd/YefM family antitoxin [Eubacteriales bacterium]
MMSEMSVMGVMKAIVPITRFNKGEANRIFEEVEASGTKIVMKNNKPACVLMSPGKYESLMEMLSDYILQEEAEARMERFDPSETMSRQEVMESLGITDADLDDVEVEIE